MDGALAASSKLYHREQTPGSRWSDWEESPTTAEENGVHVTLEHLALALNAGKRLELSTRSRAPPTCTGSARPHPLATSGAASECICSPPAVEASLGFK
jgi:hypothetical protein